MNKNAYNIQELASLYRDDPHRFFIKLRFDMMTAAGMITRCPTMTQKKMVQVGLTSSVSVELNRFQADILPLVTEIKRSVGGTDEEFSPDEITHHYILDFYTHLYTLNERLDQMYDQAPLVVRREINRLMVNDEFFDYYRSPVKLLEQLLDVMKAVMMAKI